MGEGCEEIQRARLDQARQVDAKGAYPDAVGFQGPPLSGRERRQLFGQTGAVQKPARLQQTKGDPARQAAQGPLRACVGQGAGEVGQGRDAQGRLFDQEALQTALGAFASGQVAKLADKPDPGRERVRARQGAGRPAMPVYLTFGAQAESGMGLGGQLAQAPGDFRPDRPHRRLTQSLVLQSAAAALGLKVEAQKPADRVAFDHHLAARADARQKFAGRRKPAQKRRRAPVYEPLHQLFMQPVRQPVLQLAAPGLPPARIAEPAGAVGGVGQGAHARQPLGQGVDFSVFAVKRLVLRGDPVFGQAPGGRGQVVEHRAHQPLMLVLGRLAKVRRLTGVPQGDEGRAVPRPPHHILVPGQGAQSRLIQAFGGKFQALAARRPGQGPHQLGQRSEVEIGRAPFSGLHRLIGVVLDRFDQILVNLLRLAGDAKGSVLAIAARPPGDLTHLLRG